jgi:hypothetical protein
MVGVAAAKSPALFSDRHRAAGRQPPLIQIKPASAVGWSDEAFRVGQVEGVAMSGPSTREHHYAANVSER